MVLPRPARRRHSIVLTSLVDVMFVLLFFFMLAAHAVEERRSIGIGMPVVGGEQRSRSVVRLELHANARWELDASPVAPDQLRERLLAAGAREVIVRAAPGVSVQTLADVLGTVRACGLVLRLAAREAG